MERFLWSLERAYLFLQDRFVTQIRVEDLGFPSILKESYGSKSGNPISSAVRHRRKEEFIIKS